MDVDTNGYELGDYVRDTVTGAEGTITGIHQWLTGCARVSVQGRVAKDGKVPDANSSDVLQLELIKAGPKHDVNRSKGGPQNEPARW